MSMCSVCGSLEYWHREGKHSIAVSYCPKCQPKTVTILPLDKGDVGAHKYDIDEVDIHGMPTHNHSPSPVSVKSSAGKSSAISFNNPNTGLQAVGGQPADFAICGPTDGQATSLSIDGAKIFVAYDELPKDAAQGQMACIRGENITYVFDGEEWQNLGEALLGKKRNVLTPKDEKIDRRAAVAATKAKNNA